MQTGHNENSNTLENSLNRAIAHNHDQRVDSSDEDELGTALRRVTSSAKAKGKAKEVPSLNVFDSYVELFREHLASFTAHLAGELEPSDQDHIDSFTTDQYSAASASHMPLSWADREKNAFFHALSRYSRMRPDLIAEAVKTKTVVDVVVYLDLLENGAEQNPWLTAESSASPSPSTSSPGIRDILPFAATASDEWIAMEELQSSKLVVAADVWERSAVKRKRAAELNSEKARFSAHHDDESDEDENIEGDETAESPYRVFKKARTTKWAHEDVLESLDYKHLVAFGGILNQANEESANSLANRNTALTPAEEDHHPPRIQNANNIVTPAVIQQHSSSSTDDAHIDPTLLTLSQTQLLNDSNTQSYATPSLSSPSLQPVANSSSVQLFAPTSSQMTDTTNEVDVDSMSPKSRRRYKKLMCQRRQRGIDSTDPGPLKRGRKPTGDQRQIARKQTVERRKAAKEAKAKGNSVPVARTSSAPQETPAPPESIPEPEVPPAVLPDPDPSENAARIAQYALKNKLSSKGIDASVLVDAGLGLINLSYIGRLMRIHQPEDPSPPAPIHTGKPKQKKGGAAQSNSLAAGSPAIATTRISASTINYLDSLVREFVTELVQRSIVSKKVVTGLKSGSKVFRIAPDSDKNLEIQVENVHRALDMMGVVCRKKREALQLLADRLEAQMPPDTSGPQSELEGEGHPNEDDNEDMDVDNDNDNEDLHNRESTVIGETRTTTTRIRELHRELYPPLIRLPCSAFSDVKQPGSWDYLDCEGFDFDLSGGPDFGERMEKNAARDQDDEDGEDDDDQQSIDDDESEDGNDTEEEAWLQDLEAENLLNEQDVEMEDAFEAEIRTNIFGGRLEA